MGRGSVAPALAVAALAATAGLARGRGADANAADQRDGQVGEGKWALEDDNGVAGDDVRGRVDTVGVVELQVEVGDGAAAGAGAQRGRQQRGARRA